MNCEIIEQDFRAAEEYAKVRHVKPEGMKLFLDDLKTLELESSIENITEIVQKIINESRFDRKCKMLPSVIFKKVLEVADPKKLSHWYAD